MKALVTGGAGFVAHYLVQHLLYNTDWEVDIIDKLSYAARGFDRLREIGVFENPRARVFTHDIAHDLSDGLRKELGTPDYIFHLAAESHVDRSVEEPIEFVRSNVLGTTMLLWWLRYARNLKKFIYLSTDEVFGPAIEIGDSFTPDARHNPKNPYAASKSGGEMMCVAFEHTYKMPIVIAHCCNVFGYRQHPEKFIPKAIKLILNEKTVEVYTDDEGNMGGRYYIHAEDVARILHGIAVNECAFRENIATIYEKKNDSMVVYIASVLDKEIDYEKAKFDLGKSSHDIRYELKATITPAQLTDELFYEQLADVIKWTASHPEWLEV